MDKVTFLTEMNFEGKITSTHSNMRTEFAWMCALEAYHNNIYNFKNVKDQDAVFIIFPKGNVTLNSVGVKLINSENTFNRLFEFNFVEHLKLNNKKVYYIQEGPSWFFNDYEINEQIHFYNMLMSCDGIFAHNDVDTLFYKGLGATQVHVIPTLLIEDLIKDIIPQSQDKVIIGGNFCRWYGGFQSFIVANEFKVPIFAQSSHADRERGLEGITHIKRLEWVDWMKELSTFKYAIHLMPTVAAGTFSLNCGYFGIPCIGNIKVDTQRICHPELSVDVDDVELARKYVKKLVDDSDFYKECSIHSKEKYKYFSKQNFINHIQGILNGK